MGFKSKLLSCNMGDADHCPLCRFLDGATDEPTLISVINKMDEQLAEYEQRHTELLSLITKTYYDEPF